MKNGRGLLYVVATPIGNLDDLSLRAQRTLAEVELIAAEDTRHTALLLKHFGIRTPLTALHDHNEVQKTPILVGKLQDGASMALVSDAGTPLISDPGFNLVRAAQIAGIRVVPVPGACALITALCVSGLPTDRFVFEGFPPSKKAARRKRFAELATESRTIIFYESVHRLSESLKDLVAEFGGDRPAVVARELTKLHEELHAGNLEELVNWVESSPEAQLGEVVIMVNGAPLQNQPIKADTVLRPLLEVMTVKQAVEIAARITGIKKNQLYSRALELVQKS